MSQPFLSQIGIFSFGFAPRGWAMCNGQLLPINQNQALFSLIGTMYGGNGTQTFGLPNLQGRVPFHLGGNFTQGELAGEEAHTIITNEMPQHTHQAIGAAVAANQSTPANNLWAMSDATPFETASDASMNPACLANAGASQPHENRSPYLVLNFCIALQGIFPTRN